MRFPSKSQWQRLFLILSKKEKFLFSIFAFLFFSSLSFLLSEIYLEKTKLVPKKGGSFVEGVLQEPRFLNPIFATSQVDRDLVFLLYSPLFEFKDENLEPKLAKNFEILEEGKKIKVNLKEEIFWEDGKKITSDDIVFTVELIQNPKVKSPLMNNWLGIKVEKISEDSIIFNLKRPSGIFFENLNLRPIPKHYFEGILPEELAFSLKNLFPLSSGPFKVEKINEQNGKINSVVLKRNEKYFGKKPYLEKIVFKVFKDEKDLILGAREKLIDGFLGKEIEGFKILKFSLPRYFGVFFNLEKEALKEKKVREAMSLAIDKKAILNEVLKGQGKIVDSPLLEKKGIEFDLEKANSILDKEGFLISEGVREKIIKFEPPFQFKNDLKLGSRGEEVKELQKCLAKFEDVYPQGEITGYFGPLTKAAVIKFQEKFKKEILEPEFEKGTGIVAEKTREKLNEVCFERKEEKLRFEFNLVTGEDEILKKTAQRIKEDFEKLGIKINLKIAKLEELEREIIPKKDYDMLLFGQMYGKILDPFPFWHSDQILNLSNFKDETADKILIEARETLNEKERFEKLKEFEKIILEEKPALFLFNPDLIYSVSEKIKGERMGKIFEPQERFLGIEEWYLKEKRVLR